VATATTPAPVEAISGRHSTPAHPPARYRALGEWRCVRGESAPPAGPVQRSLSHCRRTHRPAITPACLQVPARAPSLQRRAWAQRRG
jgi:hypothetical protein